MSGIVLLYKRSAPNLLQQASPISIARNRLQVTENLCVLYITSFNRNTTLYIWNLRQILVIKICDRWQSHSHQILNVPNEAESVSRILSSINKTCIPTQSAIKSTKLYQIHTRKNFFHISRYMVKVNLYTHDVTAFSIIQLAL